MEDRLAGNVFTIRLSDLCDLRVKNFPRPWHDHSSDRRSNIHSHPEIRGGTCPDVAELLITGENAGGANRSAKDGGCFVSAGGPEAPESQKGIFAGRPQRSENSETFGNGIRPLTNDRSPRD
jgi:hypothetical protein